MSYSWTTAAPIMVAANDGHVTHFVSDVEIAALAGPTGGLALCGARFHPAALSAPLAPLCALCTVAASLATPGRR